MYRRDGLRSVYLGDEAIIRCDSFTLASGSMKAVQTALRIVVESPAAMPRVRSTP
jgi:lysylphosphatidylglycerol synthetase-like protein (DUF2156 family)